MLMASKVSPRRIFLEKLDNIERTSLNGKIALRRSFETYMELCEHYDWHHHAAVIAFQTTVFPFAEVIAEEGFNGQQQNVHASLLNMITAEGFPAFAEKAQAIVASKAGVQAA